MALQHQQPNSGSGRAGGELSTALSASSSTSSSSPSPALASFLPYFRSLLQCLQVALRYPLDYSDWNEEQKDEHKKYRYQAADTLVDAVAVVGVRDTLHLLWASTTQHLVVYTQSAGQRWHELEASLHCFRAIGGRVSSEEGEVIPQLMAAVCSPSVVSPSAPFAVAYTALLLIGRYADWVNAHLHFLGPLLQLIVQALNHTPLQAAAAVAFKHTCDATSRHLAEDQAIAAAHIHPTQETAATPSSSSTSGPLSSTVPASTSSFLPALLSVYAASGSLPLTEQREIIGGMCDVVSVLDGARLSSMLQALLQPVVSALQAALSQPTASATQRQQVTAEVCLQLERLTCIIDGLEPARHEQPQLVRTALLHIAQHTWTLLTTAVQRLAEVERVLDMVGRAWRRLLKKTTPPPPPHHSSRPAHAAVNGTDVVAMQAHPPEHLFTPLLQPLLQTISQAYLQRPHASEHLTCLSLRLHQPLQPRLTVALLVALCAGVCGCPCVLVQLLSVRAQQCSGRIRLSAHTAGQARRLWRAEAAACAGCCATPLHLSPCCAVLLWCRLHCLRATRRWCRRRCRCCRLLLLRFRLTWWRTSSSCPRACVAACRWLCTRSRHRPRRLRHRPRIRCCRRCCRARPPACWCTSGRR